jgi:hypothetical protein
LFDLQCRHGGNHSTVARREKYPADHDGYEVLAFAPHSPGGG